LGLTSRLGCLQRALDCPRLALVLPKYEGEDKLIAIPLACTMGWVQLPPTFCTMSETVRDLANQAIRTNQGARHVHRLEPLASTQDDLSYNWNPQNREDKQATADSAILAYSSSGAQSTEPEPPAPPSNQPFAKPVGTTDVFMDDYIQVGQGGPQLMQKLGQHLLEAMDKDLAQPSQEAHQNEAISIKKLKSGDGSWTTSI
jgi:hypothetical protein